MRQTFFPAIIILTMIILLGACSDKDLEQDEVMQKIQENNDDVESYHTVWDVGIELEYLDMDQTETSDLNMDLKVDHAGDEISGTIKESDDAKESVREYYMMADNYYENDNDSGWISQPPEDLDTKEDLTIAYNQIIIMVDKIENMLEMETDDDHYILTFSGASRDVFAAQDEPYSLEVTGFDEDDIEQELQIEVDKDTLHIVHIENTVTAENDQNELLMAYEHDFSDINEIDGIELPDDVAEEAN